MQHEPIGSRVWVNTGCGEIAPGTVVGDHINTPGVRQITLDTGAVVHAVSALAQGAAVQQSKGFTDLAEETKQEVFQRYDARRELLENQLRALCDDVYILELMKKLAQVDPDDYVMSESHCEKVFNTARQMARTFLHGIPRRLGKQDYIQELDYWIHEKTMQRDAFERELHEFAHWKVDLLRNVPVPSVCAPLVQQSEGFPDLDVDMRGEIFKQYEGLKEPLAEKVESLNNDLMDLLGEKIILKRLHEKELLNAQIQRRVPDTSKELEIWDLDCVIKRKTAARDAAKKELDTIVPWKLDVLKKVPLPSVCASLVQQSEGFPDLDHDIREEVFKVYESWKEPLEDELYEIEFNLTFLRTRKKIFMSAPPHKTTWGPEVFKRSHEMLLPMRGPPRSMHIDDLIEEIDYQIKEQTVKRDAVMKRLEDIAPWKIDLLKKAPQCAVSGASVVKQSQAFTDLDQDSRGEVFQRFEAERKQLELEYKRLEQDVKILKDLRELATKRPEDRELGAFISRTTRRMSVPLRGAPRLMGKPEYLQELDDHIDQKKIEQDTLKEKLDDVAPWKLDSLKRQKYAELFSDCASRYY